MNGSIGGKSTLAAREIIIGNNAVFNDDVRYWNKKGALDFKQSLKNGKAIYDPHCAFAMGNGITLGRQQ